ncbi:MAG: FixG Ig-like domain-containing protein, partial [Rhodosalinus sp.]
CITCALCIDACDDVMAKIGKPRGLIDYIALSDEERERAGGTPKPLWKHVFRPRVILYTALWALVGLGLIFALFIRPEIEMTVAPVRNPINVVLSDGSVRNTYDVRLLNKHGEDRPFRISLTGHPELNVQLEGRPETTVTVPANQTYLQRVYVVAPPASDPADAERTEFRLWVEDLTDAERAHTDTIFFGRDTQ